MSSFWAGIRKEVKQLVADKVGLLLMFLMPVVLVFIISIVQDSTFKLVSENNIKVLIFNDDEGAQADSVIDLLKKSGSFEVTIGHGTVAEMRSKLLSTDNLIGLYFSPTFSNRVENKAVYIGSSMLKEFGALDSVPEKKSDSSAEIQLFYDPVLQENYRQTIVSGLQSFVSVTENKLLINKLFEQAGYDVPPMEMSQMLASNQTEINQQQAGNSSKQLIPNSAQHNVPAWSIFAMFFMVISLGSNIVRERQSGTFVRILLSPTSFYQAIVSKMSVYLGVALVQQIVIFSIGMFIFPLIGLPELQLPSNTIALLTISLLSGIAAVSYAVMIGTLAGSAEQSNGFGAISVIIFAAIGGIWVPTFVMPSYLQNISMVSPLHWCLEGFYGLFLRNGNWSELIPSVVFLTCFSLFCQLITLIKLKRQKFL